PLYREISLTGQRAQSKRKPCPISTVSVHNYCGQDAQSGPAYSPSERDRNILEVTKVFIPQKTAFFRLLLKDFIPF
ncbi:MAG: hypothetical protein AB1341_00825, partial [Bacillota bacterium]